jgi:hypothetical protein
MATLVQTNVGRFSRFQREPLRFSDKPMIVMRTCPPVLFQVKTDFSEILKKYQLNFFLITFKGIKTYGHRFSGSLVEFSVKSGKHGTSTLG